MTHLEIAEKLKELNENIILIFGFNATGKTRLSIAYKDATKNPETHQHTGVYYNAFSEDLFVWDNDEENNGANVRLRILPSRLGQFHSLLTEADIREKLTPFQPKYDFYFNQDEYAEGIESVSFFLPDGEDVPIKISRGEERTFVWCFFLALFEVDAWTGQQEAHFFIDDPVSSLDEHNIFVTADTIFDLIETHYLRKRILVTTHHIGLLSILSDRLTKGEKSGRYKGLTKLFILTGNGNDLKLNSPNNEVFLYHLHLIQTLYDANNGQLYTYHFALLRQLLENVSSFMGKGSINYVLSLIGVTNIEETVNIINTLTHKNLYYFQTELMNSAEAGYFRDVFLKLIEKYGFYIQESHR
jgi:hypothetical protein